MNISDAELDIEDDNNGTAKANEEIPITYSVFVPIFIAACVVTFFMNAVIVAAFPFIGGLSRVSKAFQFLLPTRYGDRIDSRRIRRRMANCSHSGSIKGWAKQANFFSANWADAFREKKTRHKCLLRPAHFSSP